MSVPDAVDGSFADAEHRPFAVDLELMAQRGTHARQQLVHTKRLGDVIVGTAIQHLDFAGFVVRLPVWVSCTEHLRCRPF